MTIFRFSLLALVVALGGYALYVYQQDKSVQAELAFARKAAKACGLPLEFVRLNENAKRNEAKIKAGQLWSGCEQSEKLRISCFGRTMNEGGKTYEDVNIMGGCVRPIIYPIPEVVYN